MSPFLSTRCGLPQGRGREGDLAEERVGIRVEICVQGCPKREKGDKSGTPLTPGETLGDRLLQTWETNHLSPDQTEQLIATQFDFPAVGIGQGIGSFSPVPELWIASVVPTQTALWRDYPRSHCLTLEQIPLQDPYPSLGIDRALALWGAIVTSGAPVLVIDAGTALTFTAANGDRRLIGGQFCRDCGCNSNPWDSPPLPYPGWIPRAGTACRPAGQGIRRTRSPVAFSIPCWQGCETLSRTGNGNFPPVR